MWSGVIQGRELGSVPFLEAGTWLSWIGPMSWVEMIISWTLAQVQFSSLQFSRSVMSDSLRPHESQHARPLCPSQTPGVYSDSCPSSW